jgi:alkylhydroperoxidase family enzyme
VKAHAAVAAELLEDPALVESVLTDAQSSGLDQRHKALFRFIDQVNHASTTITPVDLDVARAAGWTDEALYFAITVCALFNFYNRWIDATGVHAMSDEAHALGGKRMALQGYVRT